MTQDKIPIKIYRNLYAEFNDKIIPLIPDIKENIEKSNKVPKSILVRMEDLQKETGFDWMSEDIFYWLVYFRLLEDGIMISKELSKEMETLISFRIIRPGKVEETEIKYLTKLRYYDVIDGYIVKRPT